LFGHFDLEIGKSKYLLTLTIWKRGGAVVPHVVLNGKATIDNISKELNPLLIRNENSILKTTDVYLEREKNAILIGSLSIDGEKKTAFLAMIS
jgi:hypothetical protein